MNPSIVGQQAGVEQQATVEQRAAPSPWTLYIGSAALTAASLYVVADKAPGIGRAALGLGVLGLLTVISFMDFRTLRVPNLLVLPSLAIAAAASFSLGLDAAREALLGGLAAFGIMFAVALLGRGAMGFGDVKVAGLCGIAVGLQGVLLMVLSTFLLGGGFALGAMLLRLRKRKDTLPFTPFLVAGTIFAIWRLHLYLWM